MEQNLKVQGNLTETYYPELAENEPEGVSYFDVFVAAHIKKYGKDNIRKYLAGELRYADNFSKRDGVIATKQFGLSDGGYMLNRKDIFYRQYMEHPQVSNGARLYTIVFNWNDKLPNPENRCFSKATYSVKAGERLELQLSGIGISPWLFTVSTVNRSTGKLNTMETNFHYNEERATVQFGKPGTYYIAPSGKLYLNVPETVTGEVSKVVVTSAGKPVIGKVSKLKVKCKKGRKLQVSWKKVKGASGYEVSYAVKGSKSFRTVTTGKSKITLKKLDKGKTYVIKVGAIKKVGKQTRYGNEIRKTSGKIK